MIKKIKEHLLTSTLAVTLVVPFVGIVATTSVAAAACTGVSQGVAQGVNAATNQTNGSSTANGGGIGGSTGAGAAPGYCASTNVSTDDLKSLAAKVTNIFSIVVGAASVIMIIYGGFRYIISGGESGRVGAAKNSLIYAIIGLVIVALAQLIIHFVLHQSQQLGS
jgi:hypothetical protein